MPTIPKITKDERLWGKGSYVWILDNDALLGISNRR
jgi:hypothetical protein